MPISLQRILCPTDFSESSHHALTQATAIAGRYKASLVVLHVHDSFLESIPGLPASSDKATDDELQRIRERVAGFSAPAIAAGVAVEVLVDLGRPAHRILERAAVLPADLIVMGTHGASGFEYLMLGSTAERVLRKASCAVLTVPPRAAGSAVPFKRILCAVDFSVWSLRALEFARSLASESDAGLTVLSVIEWPWEEPPAPVFTELPAEQAAALRDYRRYIEASAMQRLKALTEANAGPAAEPRLSHGKASARILQTAADIDADLIVIGVHGRPALDLRVFGSTANQVVRQAICPVLTLRS